MTAVVFDLDGTLVDSRKVVLEAFRYAVVNYDVSLTEVQIESVRTTLPEKMFESFVGKENALAAYERLRSFSWENAHRVKTFDGVHEVLADLQKEGIKMAIWTGRESGSAKKILEANQMDHYFEATISACHVRRNKPNPEGLRLICDKMGISTHNVFVVGDHRHDLLPAKEIGARTIGVGWFRYAEWVESCSPDHVCSSPSQILNVIRKGFPYEERRSSFL